MGVCYVCRDAGEPDPTVRDIEIIDHMQGRHPELVEPLECWPDGTPAITDLAPEMDDFQPPGEQR